MGGSSKVATKMAEEGRDASPKTGSGYPKASATYPTWNVNATDELDDSALMDLVSARAAVIAAMRMCSAEDLPTAGQRLAQSMSVERQKEEGLLSGEPMVVEMNLKMTGKVETNLNTTDKAKKDTPCYVHPAPSSELCWRDIDNLREKRRDLLLRGLPRRLCSVGGMRKLLGAVDLQDSVESITAQCAPGRRVGHAILRVNGASALRRAAHFFHGWQCGSSMPIAASFFSPHSKGILGGIGGRPRASPPAAGPAFQRQHSLPAILPVGLEDQELPLPPASFQRRTTD